MTNKCETLLKNAKNNKVDWAEELSAIIDSREENGNDEYSDVFLNELITINYHIIKEETGFDDLYYDVNSYWIGDYEKVDINAHPLLTVNETLLNIIECF